MSPSSPGALASDEDDDDLTSLGSAESPSTPRAGGYEQRSARPSTPPPPDGDPNQDPNQEIVINVDAVPLACCLFGAVMGWTANACCVRSSFASHHGLGCCMVAVALAYLFQDTISDTVLEETEGVLEAVVTALSAQDADLRPVRDISELSLPSMPFDPQSETLQKQCSVCFEDFEANEAVCHLYCGHTFHPACIYKWALYKNDCPMCRTELESRRRSPPSSPAAVA